MKTTYHIIEKPQFNLDVKFIEFDVAEAYNGFLIISFRKRKYFYYEGADILIILNEVYYFLKDIIDKKEYPQLNIMFSLFYIAKIKGVYR